LIRVNPYWFIDPPSSESGSSNQTKSSGFISEPGASPHVITDQTKSNQILFVRARKLLSLIKSFFHKKLLYLQDSKLVRNYIRKRQIETVSTPPVRALEVDSSLTDSRPGNLPQERPIVSTPPTLPQVPPIETPVIKDSSSYTNIVLYVVNPAYITTCAVYKYGCSWLSVPFGCMSSLASGAMSATSNVLSVAYAAAEAMALDYNPYYFAEEDKSDKQENSDSHVVEVPPKIPPPSVRTLPEALPLAEPPVPSQPNPTAPSLNLKVENLECSKANQDNIGYLINAFPNWYKASLLTNVNSLIAKFTAVSSVHPLKFLSVVFFNQSIKDNMLKMFESHPKYTSSFFDGFNFGVFNEVGLNARFTMSKNEDGLLPYLEDFARITGKELLTLRQFVTDEKWEEMFRYVLDAPDKKK